MIALADQIVSEGMNPFCFGMESEGASGWLATDWMEDIMLRTGEGTVTYDKWVNHEIPFNDPVVQNAATLLSQIMHTEGYVVGGTDAIVSTYFGNAQDPMFEKDANGNPGCFMHRQASFITISGLRPHKLEQERKQQFSHSQQWMMDYQKQLLVEVTCSQYLLREMKPLMLSLNIC